MCIHIFSTVQVSHLKNRTKTNKKVSGGTLPESPALRPPRPRFRASPGRASSRACMGTRCSTRFGHKRGVPTHARLPGRSVGLSGPPFTHQRFPPWDQVGSALSSSFVAHSASGVSWKTSLVSEEKGQNPHTDSLCPGVKNPWTALSGLPGKGWTKTAQGLPKINILRGFLLFAGSSLSF